VPLRETFVDNLHIQLNIAGLVEEVLLSAEELSTVYRPVLKTLMELPYPEKRGIVFLAGPPGSGKSTFAAILQSLAREQYQKDITILPMDGFHFSNDYLKNTFIEREGENIRLSEIKGAPESFDLDQLKNALRLLRTGKKISWPRYDRTIHEVVPDAIPISDAGLFIVEGNYLLLDEPEWRELVPFAQKTIFLSAPEDLLVERLIGRHIRGGKKAQEARLWVNRTDLKNIQRVISRQSSVDMRILQKKKGTASLF
jgi:putative kinase